MKAVFIVFSQTNTERIEYMLDRLEIRGFTFWEDVQGCGTGNYNNENHRLSRRFSGLPRRASERCQRSYRLRAYFIYIA